MLESIMLSIGSLLFLIVLVIVYKYKIKLTHVKNKFFSFLLNALVLVLITEMISVYTIHNCLYIPLTNEIVCRIHGVLLLFFLMLMSCYLISLGERYEIDSFIKYLKEKKKFRDIFLIFILSLIIFFMLPLKYVITSKTGYLRGLAFDFVILIGIIVIITSIYIVITDRKTKKIYKKSPIIICAIETLITIFLQIKFPTIYILTTGLVFTMYVLYFTMENPDLYLIDELRKAKYNAESSLKAKSDFLSNMSHEIKTPMNAIIVFSGTLLNSDIDDTEEIKKDIEHIYYAGSNLLEIINNILDISKIENGEEKVLKSEYNLNNIVSELTSIIEHRIDKTKVSFIANIDKDIPSVLKGDKTKIFQILLNLLSNAVKYTPSGKIELTVDYKQLEEKALLNFKISDTGYGIKKEDYNKLFEKFSRLDNATKNEIEGTGLGLLITKRLVNLLDGDIKFESEYGVGTTFYVTLEQDIVNKNKISDVKIEKEIKNEIEYIDCSKYKVLLVDDNILNLKVATRLLEPYKFNITTFNNGQDCINDIKSGSKYDIIFLDHMMPNVDGIEVLHILKDLGINLPPIIVLTANAISGMKEMYLSEGFDDYLSKPINVTKLNEIIKRYF